MQARTGRHQAVVALLAQERRVFAAKMRAARAVLGWSQSALARHVGMTQRAIHKLEQGETEPRRATILAMETVWREEGLAFEDLADGRFRLTVPPSALVRLEGTRRRSRAGRESQHDLDLAARYRG